MEEIVTGYNGIHVKINRKMEERSKLEGGETYMAIDVSDEV